MVDMMINISKKFRKPKWKGVLFMHAWMNNKRGCIFDMTKKGRKHT
jgi:hypothetical protein